MPRTASSPEFCSRAQRRASFLLCAVMLGCTGNLHLSDETKTGDAHGADGGSGDGDSTSHHGDGDHTGTQGDGDTTTQHPGDGDGGSNVGNGDGDVGTGDGDRTGDGDGGGDGDAPPGPGTGCKRGVAYGENSAADLTVLSSAVSWWYNWSDHPEQGAASVYQAQNVEFVPMVWDERFNVADVVSRIPDDAKYLLAFNEPNFTNQANLTPQQAADLWPQIEQIAQQKNLQIASPALNYCGGGCNETDPFKYLDAFFAACQNCKIDYLAVHWYACDQPALSWYVEQMKKYGKPIWLTEFACGDGNDRSLDVQKKYMTEALNYLENEPAVFRYSWFAGRSDAIPNVSLLAGDGQLSELGQLYVSLPQNAACKR